jgi:ribokinase
LAKHIQIFIWFAFLFLPMNILTVGSLNIDEVYTMADIVRPGETSTSLNFSVFPGGKGSNQAVAISLAGANSIFFGKLGNDGQWVLDVMKSKNVHVSHCIVDQHLLTGRAIIQVSNSTHDNAIILAPNANLQIQCKEFDKLLENLGKIDAVLLQNEINPDVAKYCIARMRQHNPFCIFCINPAPCPKLENYLDLNDASILVMNWVEAQDILLQFSEPLNMGDPKQMINQFCNHFPKVNITVITKGTDGVWFGIRDDAENIMVMHEPAHIVDVVDTTGAGDTFVGYFLATLVCQSIKVSNTSGVMECIKRAVAASALSVQKSGAMDSIPTLEEVELAQISFNVQ